MQKHSLVLMTVTLWICAIMANAQGTGDWGNPYSVIKNQPEADVIIRVGDIDNLGFGWPEEYTPFSGIETPPHDYPWETEGDDPQGTDRIFVGTSYVGESPMGIDGYTAFTYRPDNEPQPITLEYSLIGIDVQSAVIRMFVDDFQAPAFGTSYRISINDKRILYLENMINVLDQTGPIGKMITIKFLPEDLAFVKTGRMVIRIDDVTTGAGDGFAVDFVELLINPKVMPYVQAIHGKVLDADTREAIGGALVSASNVVEVLSGNAGRFRLTDVPAGLALVTASKTGYATKTVPYDPYRYEYSEEEGMIIEMNKLEESVAKMGEDIDKKGILVLYGIHFESGKATLTPESIQVLEQLEMVIRERPNLKLEIAGHTDSDGTDEFNVQLSRDRAQTVVDWLAEHGITNILTAQGYGENSPVSSNNTAEGKAANRRVEIRVISSQ